MLQKIRPELANQAIVVAAPGPSLTAGIAEYIHGSGLPVLACQDAYRLMPWADYLYACDMRWIDFHKGCPDFEGEKWTTHEGKPGDSAYKMDAVKYGFNLVRGTAGFAFSLNPEVIFYGGNSGFQSLNMAVLLGATKIILVGYDMQRTNGAAHFFGDHPAPMYNQQNYEQWCDNFQKGRDALPQSIEIINATTETALTCFPRKNLHDAIRDGVLHRDRAKPYSRAS